MRKKKTLTAKLAIKSLQTQINLIGKAHYYGNGSSEHIKWILVTQDILNDVFGKNSIIYQNFVSINWSAGGRTFVTDYYDYEQKLRSIKNEALIEGFDKARGILEAGINLIRRKGIKAAFTEVNSDEGSTEIVKIMALIENKLRKTIRNMPNNEKEIQDALENLFYGANLDGEFSREKETIEYSSKNYIPDFTFKKISTIVEIKLCDNKNREKEIIAEINDDILAYKTKFSNLLFVVYDVGTIRDQDKFRDSLQEHESVIVKIVKH